MRLFPPAIEIDPDEGFNPTKDIFGRAGLGAGLTNLVATVSQPLVIAVDGQWGSGKTVFLKMWAGELRKADFPVTYFDAFEHDYVDDAFAAIAGEIIDLVRALKKAKTSKGKKFLTSAARASAVLLRASAKIGTKAATLGVLTDSDIQDVAEDVADAIAGATDSYLEKILTSRKEERNALEQFRKSLCELPLALASDADKHKPLIFIIDELDRCRPTFALEVLERIKHFFSVPNVHFVLGVHSGQLENAVSATYGRQIKAGNYLQKFITLRFFLYDRADSDRERTARKFVNYLVRVMELGKQEPDLIDTAASFIGDIAIVKEISLREIERIMTFVAIGLAFTPNTSFRDPTLLAGLAILKVIAPDLYVRAKRGTLKFEDVRDGLSLIQWKAEFCADNAHRADRIFSWWRFVTEGHIDEDFKETVSQLSFRYGFRNGRSLVPFVANDVLDRFAPSPST